MKPPWNRAQDGPPSVEWDQSPLAWPGPALVDLHDGHGTTWRKTAGGYWPDCKCHGERVRSLEERHGVVQFRSGVR